MATAKNTNEVLSPTATISGAADDVTHITLWTASSGGSLLLTRAVSGDPDAIAAGERFRVVAQGFVLTQTASGGETELMAKRALAGRLGVAYSSDTITAATVYMQYHTGDPGAGGTANIANDVTGRVQITHWTLA